MANLTGLFSIKKRYCLEIQTKPGQLELLGLFYIQSKIKVIFD